MAEKKHSPKGKKALSLPDSLFNIARQNPQGFTVRVKDGKIEPFEYSGKERFIVSTTNNTTKKQVRRDFRGFKDGIAGGWYDAKTKKYFIDKNVAVANEDTAFRLGRKYRQKAIFDFRTKKAVDVPHEVRLAKRKRRKKYKKPRLIRIQRTDKRVQRYRVSFNPYEHGYFYDRKQRIWIHAKRFVFYAARGFYRINTVEPDHFFSTEIIRQKMFTGRWYPMAYFNALLNRVLRPNLSNKNMLYDCYRFFAYEYKRGYLFYKNGKLHLLILEEHSREKT